VPNAIRNALKTVHATPLPLQFVLGDPRFIRVIGTAIDENRRVLRRIFFALLVWRGELREPLRRRVNQRTVVGVAELRPPNLILHIWTNPRYQRNPRLKTSVAVEPRWAIRGSNALKKLTKKVLTFLSLSD
jgi:hypothetical protein